jgi:serine/threonine protein kinase
MADFKTALDALASGKLSLEALAGQLAKLLKENPKFATRLLSQLDEAHKNGRLDNKAYTELKRQINDFRRTHATETESVPLADPDSTEFARDTSAGSEDSTQINRNVVAASEDSTEIKAKKHVDTEDATEIKSTQATGTEDSTEIKGSTRVSSEDSTEIRGGNAIGSEESTEIRDRTRSTAGDSTEVLDESQSVPTGQSSVDFDISMESNTSPSFGTGPTGTGWEEPQQQTYSGPGHALGVGDVIKQRFKLLDVLGVGGMGKVFKGIDLLKEEARDKNPYLAIKLLNDDFKSHPEAFISLQRESSRQQKLAHPNIATVYDFDRIAGRGTPVFITMELMEGQPLNTYIKKVVKKQGGLPFPEAYNIIKQLGAALQYAHERRLVHSDFKPGNAFLCNDGTVKTLDFGIARAVKNPVTGEAEKTLFDPGKLGALTPAYASLEMLEGEEPDTRDDTYALGCVAYELLTSKHPFNKLPATTARDNGLVPPVVKGLNKKQNRALRRSVAFKRDDRPQTVSEFIEELEGKATWHKNPITIAAGILLVIGIMLINPAIDYFHQKEIEAIIADMNTGGNAVLVEKLDEMRLLEKADQVTITDQAREAIQRYYSSEIARNIDISSNNYNFPNAATILASVEQLYPASLFTQQQRNEIEFNKKQKISELYQQFIAALDPAQALQNPDSIDGTKAVLEIIRNQIDPQHPLLTDSRPSNAYRLAANLAFENGNLDQALSFVTSGLQNAADDPLLTDLQTKVQNAIRTGELNRTLTDLQQQTQLASLDNFKQNQAPIIELAGLSNPEASPILTTLSGELGTIVKAELARILGEGDRATAQTLAADIGPLLTALSLANELTQIKLAHLSGEERTAAIQNMVATDKTTLETGLATPDLANPQWESEVLASVRQLDALQSEDPTLAEALTGIRESLARLFIDSATTTLNANRFDAAEILINRGLKIAPEMVALIDTRNLIANNRAEYEKQLRISGLKDQFQVAVEADNITEANQIFETLKIELPPEDGYITAQAPRALSESYRRLAERRAESSEFASALQLAEAAVKLNPRDAGLQGIFEEYRARVNITELTDIFRNARVFTENERADLARKVNEIERGAPGEYSDFLTQAETILAERINSLAASDENGAAALADTASRIFSDSSVLLDLQSRFQLEPWPERVVADAALQAGELTKAGTLLQTAQSGQYATHPDVLSLQKMLEESINAANDAYQVYTSARAAAGEEYGKLNAAKRLLYRAQGLWVDNPEYTTAESDIDVLIANAPDNPSKRILQRADENIASVSADDMIRAAADWKPIPSDRACTPDKASYGSRARAICYDFINTGWRGPQMVVVPAGGTVANSFAIGKYEVSVADWSKYCALTGNCTPVTDRSKFDDPITGITLEQAQQYVNWLSERTGKTYRLPSAQEWEYAASVGGELTAEAAAFRDIKGQLNCRVTLGDKVLKGTGLATIKSGKPNKWGVYNFVGNVQEWVQEDSGASARGGAYSDAINNCEITTIRPHDGSADEITGFRVILEDVG